MSGTIPPLDWSPKWLVGVPALDAQHQFLVQQLNYFSRQVEEGVCSSGLLHTLRRIIEYTYAHQTLEESLIRDAGLASVNAHAHEHRAVLDLLKKQSRFLKTGRTQDVHAIRHALLLHYRNHLTQGDRDIALAIRRQNFFPLRDIA